MVGMGCTPKAEGNIVIGGRVYPADKVFNALVKEGFADVRVEAGGVLVIGSERIQPVFQSLQDKAMAITCYGSLAYCCGLEKNCATRDEALRLLGLSDEDYLKIKKYMHNKFIEYARGLWGTRDEQLEQYFTRDNTSFNDGGNYCFHRRNINNEDGVGSEGNKIFCTFCGETLPLDARFCKRCGHALR
ncbi:MAG: zinc-ribbon domain-containing protein [Candidatus Jordarchaeales archaeon]